MGLPTPPVKSMTDFVVFAFVTIVAVGLISGWVAVVILFVTERDPATLMNPLLDITTTIIGALVGFIAGKGTGKAEAHEEMAAKEHP